MPPVGYETILSAGEGPQTYGLRPRGYWDRLNLKVLKLKPCPQA